MSTRRARNPNPAFDPKQLESAMLRRVERSTELAAELAFAAIPALLEHYAKKSEQLFELAARPLLGPQRAQFRKLLAQALQTGFEASAHAKVVVRCRTDPPPALSASYEIGVQGTDIADVYAGWLRGPNEAHFGAHPDAKVMAVASEGTRKTRALDIGAGSGRNSLPLARLGYEVDAVDMTPGFVSALRKAAEAEQARVHAIEGDAFDPELALPDAGYSLIVASEVVSSHVRDVAELREFFELAARKLTPGGKLVCNVFLAVDGYEPDMLARQLSSSLLSALFSSTQLERAFSGLPVSLISNEPCAEYEREHLPSGAWPPTSWFESWARGGNLFDLAGARMPCELRWLVFERSA